jgi:hypothetical protein
MPADPATLNRNWCRWLVRLLPHDRSLVYADEVFYFDMWSDSRMSLNEILTDARSFAPEYEELLA